MFRRLPILPLVFAATLGVFSLTSVLLAQQPKPNQPEVKPGDVDRIQRENAKMYQRLADELLRLAQRWEKSDNPDEKERAKSLRSALKIADEKGLKNLFDEIVKGLANPNLTGSDYSNLLGKDAKIVAALEEILKTLETEDDVDRIQREIAELKKLKAEIEAIKRGQENLRARTENPRGDRENIANDQKDLAKRTDAAANKFPGDKNNPNANGGGPKEDPRSESKPEQKPGDANPESKPDTAEQKSNDKAGMGSPMPGMGDPKGGEPKPSPMGGMPSGGDKPMPKDGMGAGEPKPGDAKPMGGTDPKNPKDPMNPMAGQQPPKPGDSKAQGEGKGDMKPSASQPGGEGKPMTQQQMPMGGQPSQSKPSQGGGMPMGGGGMPPMGGQQPPPDDAQENVRRAVPDQQEAEQNVRKNQNDQASKKQDDAIEKLEKAIKELEKRLKQLREKELEKLLANLEERVSRMLRMQQEVYEATKAINETVVKNNNQKTTTEVQKSQSEADKESAIIAEAEKCLKLMESEGSAVVFAGVLSEVKIDMSNVQKRLNEGRVDGRDGNAAKGTQLIEEQIIKRLTMMKEALKKARQDLQDPNKPMPPSDGNSKPPDKKLIDLINQLKLLKLEQELVNERTISYGKEDPGEQAKDPQVQTELKQLSDRQKKLQDLLHKLAAEANQ